jgi:purine nucleoside phosphorylase
MPRAWQCRDSHETTDTGILVGSGLFDAGKPPNDERVDVDDTEYGQQHFSRIRLNQALVNGYQSRGGGVG